MIEYSRGNDVDRLSRLENPIRIKVTGKCNRKCFFCHKEGGMEIDSLVYTDELKRLLEILSDRLGIHAIAITGGEPLLYNNLEELMKKLIKCRGIDKFSITTNGTIIKEKNFWKELKRIGLYKVNISMPDILNISDENQILTHENKMQNTVFARQLQTIEILNELGITVKINVAIINDLLYTTSVLENLLSIKSLKFDIVLLPNISSNQTFLYSQNIIQELCSKMDFRLVGIRTRENTSDSIMVYQNNVGQKIFIKTTKLSGVPYMLHSMCSNCEIKEKCQEGFYGLRLEQVDGKYFIRLCIHKSSESVLYSIDDFISSNVFQELEENWRMEKV